jgi:hypothetical protein
MYLSGSGSLVEKAYQTDRECARAIRPSDTANHTIRLAKRNDSSPVKTWIARR